MKLECAEGFHKCKIYLVICVCICIFQVVNPKMMDALRQQIQAEVEKPFREKVAQMDAELDKSRSDYRKLKYDFTFLKSEYDHERAEHKRVVDELTLRYEAEVS